MRARWLLAVMAVALVGVGVRPAPAMHEWEVWRSPFGFAAGPVVNPTDGSVWVILGDAVCHYRADHTLLSKTQLWLPMSLSVNAQDGSCWVTDLGPDNRLARVAALVHLSEDGSEIARASGLRAPMLAARAGPDGSVWLMDQGSTPDKLLRYLPSGGVAAQYGPLNVAGMAVNPVDGTCWALDSREAYQHLLHLDVDGTVLWSGPFATPVNVSDESPYRLACDTEDGSVWVAGVATGDAVHVSAAGVELSRTHLAEGVRTVSWDPRDRTCWVGTQSDTLEHLGTDGSVLSSVASGGRVLNPLTGTFWPARARSGIWPPTRVREFAEDGTVVWETGEEFLGTYVDTQEDACSAWSDGWDLVRFDATGHELARCPAFSPPHVPYLDPLAISQADGSLYVVFTPQAELARVARDGSQEWVPLAYPTDPEYLELEAAAVDPRDGSFWVSLSSLWDAGAGAYVPVVFHFSADGSEICRLVGDEGAVPADVLAVDAADGSVWIHRGTAAGRELGRFTPDGAALWTQPSSAIRASSLSINPTDRSCWTGEDKIRHVALDGTVLLEIDLQPEGLSVDPVTGDCWAYCGGYLCVFDTGGRRLWEAEGFTHASDLAVSAHGSLWLSDLGNCQVVHLWAPTTPFSDVLPGNWAGRAIRMCYEYGIVGGYPDGAYHPDWGVTRAQMAGFIARSLAGGDTNVPPGPETPHFPDVGTDYWAYKYVEYAYANNIVAGYPGGNYVPELAVDRGQMAAFIARAIVTPTGEAGLASYTPPATPTFPDVPTDFWTYKHIEYIKSQGIVGGYPDGLYHPGELCTRDQMAVFIARAFDLLPY